MKVWIEKGDVKADDEDEELDGPPCTGAWSRRAAPAFAPALHAGEDEEAGSGGEKFMRFTSGLVLGVLTH